MKQVILIAQIIISLLLILVILLQVKGEGLSSFSLEEKFSSKTGVEKFLFIATIILGILFFAIILANYLF
ncbi:MAG: preprotein translocase subunit SecG [Microgenomates group bacterium]